MSEIRVTLVLHSPEGSYIGEDYVTLQRLPEKGDAVGLTSRFGYETFRVDRIAHQLDTTLNERDLKHLKSHTIQVILIKTGPSKHAE